MTTDKTEPWRLRRMLQMWDHRKSICVFVSLFVLRLAVTSTSAAAADDKEIVRELGKIKAKQLQEISGLAASRQNADILWLHNDGGSGMVFAVETSGKVAKLVRCPGTFVDLEDIAIAPGPKPGTDYLYLGDIGDNNEERHNIRVVRFEEPQLTEAHGGQIAVQEAEEFRLVYPDGPHNAETLIVDPVTGDIFVVTKDRRRARLFTCPAGKLKDRAPANLELIGIMDMDAISGGTISLDGSRIILRRESQGWLWTRKSGESVAAALQKLPQKIPVRDRRQGANGEAVSFNPDGDSYYTVSEGKDQVICEFQLPAPVADRGH